MSAKTIPLNLIESILVPHSRFTEALNQKQQVCEVSGTVTESVGKILIAEALLEMELEMCHSPTWIPDGLTVPILSVKVPSEPTVKGLVKVLLSKLGDPSADVGTEIQKTNRLMKILSETETRFIVLNEFHHFVDGCSMKLQHYLLDWLKNFIDDSGVAVVVVGLESATAVLDQNEQLRGRFLAPALLRRFDWNDKNLRSEFVAVLSSIGTALEEIVDLPAMANANIGFRIYVAPGGLLADANAFEEA